MYKSVNHQNYNPNSELKKSHFQLFVYIKGIKMSFFLASNSYLLSTQ